MFVFHTSRLTLVHLLPFRRHRIQETCFCIYLFSLLPADKQVTKLTGNESSGDWVNLRAGILFLGYQLFGCAFTAQGGKGKCRAAIFQPGKTKKTKQETC